MKNFISSAILTVCIMTATGTASAASCAGADVSAESLASRFQVDNAKNVFSECGVQELSTLLLTTAGTVLSFAMPLLQAALGSECDVF